VESSRVEKASYRLALLTGLLLSMALLLQPTTADGADGDTTTTLAMPRGDAGSQGPSSGGPVILRGTRPGSPVAAEASNVGNQAPPPLYTDFVPKPRYGTGWDTEYNYNGLNYTPNGEPE
jgi:hypothetical protein